MHPFDRQSYVNRLVSSGLSREQAENAANEFFKTAPQTDEQIVAEIPDNESPKSEAEANPPKPRNYAREFDKLCGEILAAETHFVHLVHIANTAHHLREEIAMKLDAITNPAGKPDANQPIGKDSNQDSD